MTPTDLRDLDNSKPSIFSFLRESGALIPVLAFTVAFGALLVATIAIALAG